MALYTIVAALHPKRIDAGVSRTIDEACKHGRRAVRERLPSGVGCYFVYDKHGREVASGSRTKNESGALVWFEVIA